MANDPGEWYAERAAEAERLEHELAGARQVMAALVLTPAEYLGGAYDVVRRLERALERARYVGD